MRPDPPTPRPPDPPGLAARAAEAIAGFTSTRSKHPEAVYGGAGGGGPTHFVRAQGARVETADGRTLLDWTMALGAVALGYGHPRVTEEVDRAVRDGVVGPLAPLREVELAERLTSVYPGAESARFFKTGAEAVAAAVRLARVVTGRETVVHCGYHGWLDGPTKGPGVSEAVAASWHAVPFDDVPALEDAVDAHRPAAILLEPVVEHAPSLAWLAAARRCADARGAVLVFDEIKTAFRLAAGGAAQCWGVRPDLAVLGKALANGFPLAALLGRRDAMARLRETWVSSTLATEQVALAASAAVLDVWEEEDVAGHIEQVGTRIMEALRDLCAGTPARLHGIPAMWFLRFEEPAQEHRFLLDLVGRGVMLKRGAYNFPSLAHGDAEAARTVDAVRAALRQDDAA